MSTAPEPSRPTPSRPDQPNLRRPPSTTTQPTRDPGSLVQAGGWAFLLTAFVGRMPSSMVQLGYLMVLSQDGRGLAIGGLAVAAVGLGTAVGAPVVGRLVDRLGPLPVLAGATLISLAGQLGFLALLVNRAPSSALLACAAVVGAANPQIGPVARSHWSHLAARLGAPHLMAKALGYEGAVDEIGFVVGPVLASVLVGALGAVPAAVAMIVLTLLLQGAFLLHLWRSRRDGHAARAQAGAAASATGVGSQVLWPMLACLGVGVLFGATQTALTALFEARGMPGITGVVYGCVGVGSGAASIAAGRLSPRVAVPVRVACGALAMVAGCLAMMQLPGAVLASLVALVLGCGAGITLVSSFGWMERIAPRHRVATMMTVLSTCLTLGVSAGAATAGRLAAQPSHAFWPVLASAALAVAAALGMRLGGSPSRR